LENFKEVKMKKKNQAKIFNEVAYFRINKSLLDELDKFCKERNWKKSFVIREALKKYLKEEK